MAEDPSLSKALSQLFDHMANGGDLNAPRSATTHSVNTSALTNSSTISPPPPVRNSKRSLPPLQRAASTLVDALQQQHPPTSGYYSELQDVKWIKKFDGLRLAETTSRTDIITSQLDAWEERVLVAQSALRAALRLERKAREEEVDKKRIQRMMEDRLAALLFKDVQASRRRIRIEYELGFDDISTYFRVCLRTQVQIAAVLKSTASEAQTKGSRIKAAQEQAKEESKRQFQQMQFRSVLEAQELRARKVIESRELAVHVALIDAFKVKLKRMAALEYDAQELHQRHIARVRHIALELERVSNTDEAAARDRLLSTEKKAFENYQYSIIDSQQRAMQLHLVRQRKEIRDRAEIEDREARARDGNLVDYHSWAQQTAQDAKDEFDRALVREARAKKAAAWAAIENTHAERELKDMFEADNDSWRLVMYTFEEELQYDAVSQERYARSEIQTARLAEKAFINSLMRQRHNLLTSSLRARNTIEQECRDAYLDITNRLQDAQDRHSVEWYEMFRRRLVEDEFATDAEAFVKHGQVLSRSAPYVPAGIRKMRTEKPVSHPDAPHQLHLRRVVMPWFFCSDAVSFLDKGALRPTNKFGELVEKVEGITIRCEILNPHDGDELLFDGPAEVEEEAFDIHKVRRMTDEMLASIADCEVEYIGKSPRQASTSFAPPTAPPTLLHFKYTGNTTTLIEGLKFQNVQPFSKLKLMHRQINVSFGDLNFPIFIGVMPPLLTTPDVTVTTNVVTPLSRFVGPPVKEYRRVRLQMQVNPGGHADDNIITFKLPAGYFNHPKYGIQLNGKATMRLLKQTQHEIEVEFDNNTSINPKALLGAVRVVRREGALPLDPVEVTITLTGRDESATLVHQLLDVDCTRSQAPRLRVPALELSCRVATCNSATSLLDHAKHQGHLPAYPLLARASVSFPEVQESFCGGLISFDVVGEDAGYVSLSLQSGTSEELDLEVSEGKLWCLNPVKRDGMHNERELVGMVFGNRTNGLVITFDDSSFVPTSYIDSLLRSVVFNYHPGAPPKATKDRCFSLDMRLDVRTDLQVLPIEVSFKMLVLPPVVDLNSLTMGYREGTGYKALPTMTVKPPTYAFKPEARIHMEIVSGLEADDSDELSILDSEPDNTRGGTCWITMSGQKIASWIRHSKTELTVFCCPPSKEAELWRRTNIEDPYPQFNFVSPDVPPSHINFILRSLVYQSTSSNAEFTSKAVKLTIDDGLSGCSTAFIEVKIESVDDPTDILLSTDTITYRQFTHQANRGCALMPSVILEDIDSDNFHGGYITVEYASGPTEAGDSLFVLNPSQQEEVIMAPRGLCNTSAMNYLMEFGGDTLTGLLAGGGGAAELFATSMGVSMAAGMSTLGGSMEDTMSISSSATFDAASTPSTMSQRYPSSRSIRGGTVLVGYLSLVLEEQPPKCLIVRDSRLFYNGDCIGTLAKKLNTTKHTTVLTFNFKSDSRFVSFPAAQYIMRCVAYENLSPKMPAGPRVYNVRLNCTGLKSTAESVVKITVDGQPSPLNIPTYATASKFEGGDKPLMLVKQLTCTVAAPIVGGYLMATLTHPSMPKDLGDTLVVIEGDNLKLRDNNILYKGTELVGTIGKCPHLSEEEAALGQHMLYIALTKIPHAEALMTIVRALAFINKGQMTQLRSRHIQIECSLSGDPQEATSTSFIIDVARKDAPLSLKMKNKSMVFLTGSLDPITLLHGVAVQDPKGKGLTAGHTIEVTINNPSPASKGGCGGGVEGIVVHTTSNIVCRHGMNNVTLHTASESGQVSPKAADTSKRAESPSAVRFMGVPDGMGSSRSTAGTIGDVGGPPIASAPRAGAKVSVGSTLFPRSLLLTLEVDVTATELNRLLQCLAYTTNNKVDGGVDKSISVLISKPRGNNETTPIAHLDLSVLVIPETIDCSRTPATVSLPRAFGTFATLGDSLSTASLNTDEDDGEDALTIPECFASNPKLNKTSTPADEAARQDVEDDDRKHSAYLFAGVRVQVPEEADGVEVSVALVNQEDGDLVELGWRAPVENPVLVQIEQSVSDYPVDVDSHFTFMGTVTYANVSKSSSGRQLLGLIKKGRTEVLLIPGSTPAMEGVGISSRNSDAMGVSFKSMSMDLTPKAKSPGSLSPRLAVSPSLAAGGGGALQAMAVDSLALQGFLRGVIVRNAPSMSSLPPERWAGKAVDVEVVLSCSLGQNRQMVSILL